MAIQTVIGRLAADPESVDKVQKQLVKFRVLEDTGEYRQGEWVRDDAPTTYFAEYFAEADFETAQFVLEHLHKGDTVMMTGRERSWYNQDTQSGGRTFRVDRLAAVQTKTCKIQIERVDAEQ